MKITAIGTKIQIEVDEAQAGGLVLDSMPSAIEVGTVISIGDEVKLPVKKGDRIMYKSWGVDICTYEGKRYLFIDESTKGICGIITK